MDFVQGENAGIIKPGSLIIVFLHHDDLDHCIVEKDGVLNNKWGSFHHNDIIGKEFGVTWQSRGKRGWLYVLAATPELWARALNHRTQIIHELDASMISFHLALKPGAIVVESGTGSGAMSSTIARAIAPNGHLFTFEFNQSRVEAAKEEFAKLGLTPLITVQHSDVCAKPTRDATHPTGFMGVMDASADAVSL